MNNTSEYLRKLDSNIPIIKITKDELKINLLFNNIKYGEFNNTVKASIKLIKN